MSRRAFVGLRGWRRSGGFRGRVVVITGGAGGIGRALAERFGAEGARVALLDRDAALLAEATGALQASGCEVWAETCDITDRAACEAAIASIVARWGGIDVLVNNAGRTHLSDFADTPPEVFAQLFAVNLFGAIYCTHAALPSLRARRGQIIAISSIAGVGPLAARSGYAASKHALHGLFDSLRAELEGTGVDVLIACPSYTATQIRENAVCELTSRQVTSGDLADPTEVAAEIVEAARQRRRFVVLSARGKLAVLVARLAPRLYQRLMLRSLGR